MDGRKQTSKAGRKEGNKGFWNITSSRSGCRKKQRNVHQLYTFDLTRALGFFLFKHENSDEP